MRIAFIGTGYVGLVTGACFAEYGNTVWCVDVDADKIDKLNRGVIPIYEPGLEDIVQNGTKNCRLFFTSDNCEALYNTDIVFIAVGTPQSEDGRANLCYVLQAAKEIGQNMDHYMVVVDKSTV
ncbi:MAG: UDP-glucose 6-dehydrogenase, partial [Eubacteriales bacterium]|nr:UDP-glucose 6-dehydrogenase [Eubacteriales bacterium]